MCFQKFSIVHTCLSTHPYTYTKLNVFTRPRENLCFQDVTKDALTMELTSYKLTIFLSILEYNIGFLKYRNKTANKDCSTNWNQQPLKQWLLTTWSLTKKIILQNEITKLGLQDVFHKASLCKWRGRQ